MDQSTIYIVLAVICIAVGFIGGALISMLFAERDKKQLLKDGDLLPEGIDRETHTALLRIWRSTDGRLLIELRGRILTEVRQATTAQRLELESVMDQWLRWLGVNLEISKSDQEPMPPVFQPAQPSAPPAPAIMPQAVAESLPPQDIAGAISNLGKAKPEKAGGPKTMVEQIDEILQELVSRSAFSQRSVKITQDVREGIVVWLDGGRYPGMDSVPDPDIKNMIRAAAAEWERRSEHSK